MASWVDGDNGWVKKVTKGVKSQEVDKWNKEANGWEKEVKTTVKELLGEGGEDNSKGVGRGTCIAWLVSSCLYQVENLPLQT